MFGMCINKRVVIGVGVVALALLALSPRLLASLGPVLVMAICPLSMVFMMRAMRGRHDVEPSTPASTGERDRQPRELEEEVNRLKAELAPSGDERPA